MECATIGHFCERKNNSPPPQHKESVITVEWIERLFTPLFPSTTPQVPLIILECTQFLCELFPPALPSLYTLLSLLCPAHCVWDETKSLSWETQANTAQKIDTFLCTRIKWSVSQWALRKKWLKNKHNTHQVSLICILCSEREKSWTFVRRKVIHSCRLVWSLCAKKWPHLSERLIDLDATSRWEWKVTVFPRSTKHVSVREGESAHHSSMISLCLLSRLSHSRLLSVALNTFHLPLSSLSLQFSSHNEDAHRIKVNVHTLYLMFDRSVGEWDVNKYP